LKKYDFQEIKGLTADFLDHHQNDPDIQDMSLDEIEEIMRKSDSVVAVAVVVVFPHL